MVIFCKNKYIFLHFLAFYLTLLFLYHTTLYEGKKDMPDTYNGWWVWALQPCTPVFVCRIQKQKYKIIWGLILDQLKFRDLRLLFNWNVGVHIPVFLVWHCWSSIIQIFPLLWWSCQWKGMWICCYRCLSPYA